MIEKKPVKDYLIGGVAILMFLIPEIFKMTISAVFFMGIYYIFKIDTSTLTKETASFVLTALMICPIGSYYFYSNSIAKDAYSFIIKLLSEHTSIINQGVRSK